MQSFSSNIQAPRTKCRGFHQTCKRLIQSRSFPSNMQVPDSKCRAFPSNMQAPHLICGGFPLADPGGDEERCRAPVRERLLRKQMPAGHSRPLPPFCQVEGVKHQPQARSAGIRQPKPSHKTLPSVPPHVGAWRVVRMRRGGPWGIPGAQICAPSCGAPSQRPRLLPPSTITNTGEYPLSHTN
jgi:hypothetical protein